MYHNRNFELEAQRRKRNAFWIAVAIHVALIAAFALSTGGDKISSEKKTENIVNKESGTSKPLYP